jgi:hypothetical protein
MVILGVGMWDMSVITYGNDALGQFLELSFNSWSNFPTVGTPSGSKLCTHAGSIVTHVLMQYLGSARYIEV